MDCIFLAAEMTGSESIGLAPNEPSALEILVKGQTNQHLFPQPGYQYPDLKVPTKVGPIEGLSRFQWTWSCQKSLTLILLIPNIHTARIGTYQSGDCYLSRLIKPHSMDNTK